MRGPILAVATPLRGRGARVDGRRALLPSAPSPQNGSNRTKIPSEPLSMNEIHCKMYGATVYEISRLEGHTVGVRELPRCSPYRGHVLHALGHHLPPSLPTGQAERCAGQVLIPPCSLRFTRLSHSEKVGDIAWAGPDRSHPPHTHAAPGCVGAREVSGRQTPGGMKLATREGKAPVWSCACHACCSAVGRTRRLNARCGHTGRRHRVRKEPDDATERRHDG